MTYEEFMKDLKIEGALSTNFKVEAEAASQYFIDRLGGSDADPEPGVLRNCLKKFIIKRRARKYPVNMLREPTFDMKVEIWDEYPELVFSEDELNYIFEQAALFRTDLLARGKI